MFCNVRLELDLPFASSLKDKRQTVRSLRDRLRRKNVSIVESGNQDFWQRATLELIMAPRMMHRTFLAPPETPSARLATLRKAFVKAVEDPEFKAEAKSQSLDIDYSSPDEIDQFVRKLAALPADIRHAASDALKREDRTSVTKK